jgi:hypothetical protein
MEEVEVGATMEANGRDATLAVKAAEPGVANGHAEQPNTLQ